MKKTIYGECYDPRYKPTLGIDADPSITRIMFKQYKEWILQNASKADTRRLNLEYIDIIIDYVLNALQQPRVSDDAFDVCTLHIERDRIVPRVDFDPAETVIPEDSAVEVPKNEEGVYEEDGEEKGGEEGAGVIEDRNAELVEEKETGSKEDLTPVNPEPCGNDGEVEEVEEASTASVTEDQDTEITPTMKAEETGDSSGTVFPSSGHHAVNDSNEVKLKSSCRGYGGNQAAKPAVLKHAPRSSKRVSAGSVSSGPSSSTAHRRVSIGDEIVIPRPHKSDSGGSIFRTKGELSRLLLENIPREILKRMVIRWPVGDEPVVVSRAELNKQRLMITVWDVSGDPLQQNFIPFFFSHRCLFVSMYNLTRSLNDPCESFALKNLRDLDGHIPTNADVLEDWLGYVTAFSKPLPSVPFRCTDATPVLPPIIIACSFADKEELKEHPVTFHDIFRRPSFRSYRKHLVDGNEPNALIISSKFENEGEEMYAGHHLLRREIDHLARQMPFCSDNVPIQWVKFEQLIYGLQEQRKIILLYDDLTRYVSEHCNVSGTLQILPILSHFHDVGVISYFYRHPLLSNIIITRPQWLADALGSVIVSSPSKWVTTEVQVAFTKLSQEGIIAKEMLLLAYRCGRMHQRYWNETLFILNCMDLACCHPACHASDALYVPCLVMQPAPPKEQTSLDDSPSSSLSALHFSSGTAAFPIALYNQFLVRCVRSCRYAPKLFYCAAHLRLTSSHHLLVSKHRTSMAIQIEHNHILHCQQCREADGTFYPPSPNCLHIQHIVGEDVECSTSENIDALIKISTKLAPVNEPALPFQDDGSRLSQLCPRVLAFTKHHLNFLTRCWFPGLRLDMIAYIDSDRVVLDQRWRHTVLNGGTVPPSLHTWFM